MLIKNQEALKSWLVVVLEPLCDADSSALARYVLALLKKDKPEKELIKLMIEQLDVFLGDETKPFVERLFAAINTDNYFTTILPPDNLGNNLPSTTDTINLRERSHEIDSVHVTNASDLPNSPYVEKVHTTPIVDSKTFDVVNCGNPVNNHSEVAETISSSSATVKSEIPLVNSQSDITNIRQHVHSVSPPLRTNADKENQPREKRRRRASLRSHSRSRSRSRSNEGLPRRSRSRDRRINEREKIQRQFRNKSPPLPDIRFGGFHDRRRSGVTSRRIGICSNSTASSELSPRFGVNGANGGRESRQILSNSRSRSPSLEQESRNKGCTNVVRNNRTSPDHHNHKTLDQHEKDKSQRCRDFDEKGYCVRGETCPWDHGINPVVFEDINNSALIGMSLPEYNPDSPDLWMGSSTGAMVGVSPGSLLSNGSDIVGGVETQGVNHFSNVTRSGGLLSGTGVTTSLGFSQGGSDPDKHINNSGTINADYIGNSNRSPGFRVNKAIVPFSFHANAPLQRELIPIPVVDESVPGLGSDINKLKQGKRRFDLEDSATNTEGLTKRKLPLNSRLGPRLPSMQSNCSLELRKIPRGLNTIAHLNNHFTKFGKIVNIQISYDNDPEAAIVTFSTHAEANVAYRSTEAVLNNRFIKVFWHSTDSIAIINESSSMCSGMPRKNNQYHLKNIQAFTTPVSDSGKTSAENPTSPLGNGINNPPRSNATSTINVNTTIATAHVPPASLRLKNNVTRSHTTGPSGPSNAIIRKKQEEQAKAVVQLANGLRKRKQELLQSYVKQMKTALELVERCDQCDPQRANTLETIKVLQETIDKLRKEIAAEQEQIQAHIQNQLPLQTKKTKEQQKKELLDIELELIAQQQEGNDTRALQKRLEDLQRSLGVIPGNVAIGGISTNPTILSCKASHYPSGRANPRIRPIIPEGSTRVDRRPKAVVVTGFSSEEADFVLGHFKHFGEITKHDLNREMPQLILYYATRMSAEQAVLRGKIFKDKRLQITWVPVVTSLLPSTCISDKSEDKLNTIDSTKVSTSSSGEPRHGLENSGETLPELRLEDEEEDEEAEHRSWRR